MRILKKILPVILAVICMFSMSAMAFAAPVNSLADDNGVKKALIDPDEDELRLENSVEISEKLTMFVNGFMFELRKQYSDSPFTFSSPLEKHGEAVEIRSWYGYRNSINGRTSKYHGGFDLGAANGKSSLGMDVCAAGDGLVVFSGWSDYGNTVVVQHIVNGKYINTLYGHLINEQKPKAKNNTASDPPYVKEGQLVRKGDVIGHIGMTYGPKGYATGPHLHFEMRIPSGLGDPWGKKIDPAKYIDFLDVHVKA